MKHHRTGLNRLLFWLYEGNGRAPFVFRWVMLIFDFVTTAYFLWAPFEQRGRTHAFIDYFIRIKEAEISRFEAEVTDWEHREYFDLF